MLNPFAVEFRYDDEYTSMLSRDEVARTMVVVMHWVHHHVRDLR